jgi:hypothetical protein
VAFVVGCNGDPGAKPPPPHPTTPPTTAATLTAIAERAGWTVQAGEVLASTYDDCCSPGVSCLWNNPSTPYLLWSVPSDVGQGTSPLDLDGWSRTFQLRPDEAVVMIGATPPAAKYFSFRSYLQYRTEPGGVAQVLGSLGPSLNNLVVEDQLGVVPADRPIAVITTADAAVERQVKDWLADAGWDASSVFVDRIPYELVRMGLGPDQDWFAIVGRVAVFADVGLGQQYLEDTQSTVLRLTPPGPEQAPAEPHPLQPLPEKGAGVTEEGLRPSLDALEAAIAAAYPGFTPIRAESTAYDFPTYECLAEDFCSGEIRDRYYARVPNFLLPDDGTFLVAFGPNHERTGKAVYSNCSVNTIVNQLGLATVESDVFPGSAAAYVPADPFVDDLYAVVVARDCAPFAGQPCIAVPTGCPGVDFDELLMVDFRAYLEPATGAAPLASELLPDRALLMRPP